MKIKNVGKNIQNLILMKRKACCTSFLIFRFPIFHNYYNKDQKQSNILLIYNDQSTQTISFLIIKRTVITSSLYRIEIDPLVLVISYLDLNVIDIGLEGREDYSVHLAILHLLCQ